MLFFGEAQVFNSPANTHSSLPSQVHFLGITWLWPTSQLHSKCSAFRSAYCCSNPHCSFVHLWESGGKSHLAAGPFRKARCIPWGKLLTHPNSRAFRDTSPWCSAPLSYPPVMPLLQRLKPEAHDWCQGFHPFQFLSGTVCFEEHSCGSCQAPFQGKRFRWLHSLCLCQTFTFLLTPQDSCVAGGSSGRRAWPWLLGVVTRHRARGN